MHDLTTQKTVSTGILMNHVTNLYDDTQKRRTKMSELVQCAEQIDWVGRAHMQNWSPSEKKSKTMGLLDFPGWEIY